MRKLAAACALVGATTLAASAAAAGPTTFNFSFPLPAKGHGSVYAIVVKYKLPAGTTLTGTPFSFHLANGSSTPSNIRAAYVVTTAGADTWDIVVGINNPTFTKRRLSSSDGATTLDTTVQAGPIPGATVSAYKWDEKEACASFLRFIDEPEGKRPPVQVLAGPLTDKEILEYIKGDDPHCK